MGETTYSISPGTVTLIPPYVEHDHYKVSNEETVFIWCHFTFQIANVINVLELYKLPITFRLKNSIEFERVFFQFMAPPCERARG
ncbi:hypothetical protein SAMN05428981_11373 [Bacillus sp. OV194]|nr:hypothetical protein SAMN05428981_11373 [Bacillus sp. OV194]